MTKGRICVWGIDGENEGVVKLGRRPGVPGPAKLGPEYAEIKVYLLREDYEFLRALANKAGMSFSQLMREITGDLADMFRVALEGVGLDEREGQDLFLRKLIRVGLRRMADALEEGS